MGQAPIPPTSTASSDGQAGPLDFDLSRMAGKQSQNLRFGRFLGAGIFGLSLVLSLVLYLTVRSRSASLELESIFVIAPIVIGVVAWYALESTRGSLTMIRARTSDRGLELGFSDESELKVGWDDHALDLVIMDMRMQFKLLPDSSGVSGAEPFWLTLRSEGKTRGGPIPENLYHAIRQSVETFHVPSEVVERGRIGEVRPVVRFDLLGPHGVKRREQQSLALLNNYRYK